MAVMVTPADCVMKMRVSAPCRALLDGLRDGKRTLSAGGVLGPARGLLAAALAEGLGATVVAVVGDLETARALHGDASFFLGPARALLLPDRDLAPYEASPIPPQIAAERLRALGALGNFGTGVVVTTVAALHEALPPPARFRAHTFSVGEGDRLERNGLLGRLVAAGYRRVDMVELAGEFSVRGAVVDIHCPALATPLRLEFDGDAVVSARLFDAATQRSLGPAGRVEVGAAAEMVMREEERRALLERLPDPLSRRGAHRLIRLRESLESGAAIGGEERYLPWLLPEVSRLADYLPSDPVMLLCSQAALRDASERLFARAAAIYGEQTDAREPVPKPEELLARPAQVWDVLASRRQVHLAEFGAPAGGIAFSCRPLRYGPREFASFVRDLERWEQGGTAVVLAADMTEETEAVAARLKEAALLDERTAPGAPSFHDGALSSGAEVPDASLVLLPARDVLGAPLRRAGPPRQPRAFRDAFLDLKPGDPVVHEDYGIGIYQGVMCIPIEGVRQDFFLIEYADKEKLYLPVGEVHRVQKFYGTGKIPLLSRLGTAAWDRTKARVRESLRKFAEQLLRLYAERKVAAAQPFPPLREGEQEFAATFPYEETEDQERVIAEVGEGLAGDRPMDRLVCGDVGYGKTEVAIRAAFRVAMSGAQAAVLVPTTILADQHWQNFRMRFGGLPMRVEVLSRFRSPKERRVVSAGLRDGTVDVVVGTHHLLSKEVVFRRLGLLVIDEEHRFGVKQKERLKELRRNVHVLTLTATPIPRTLNMGLAGLRDLSVIETPPPGRLSVVTHVLEESAQVAREAILREMGRGGQVFYLHNRVRSIGMCARRLAEAVPEARILLGHGQMDERELARTMEGFAAGRADVLVCTSIIGSGLDLPNANTLIVERAETFGLADLYQLRGRVGRSARQAYAYFFFSPRGTPTLDARRRLAAMLEFGELGSGFRLALRDLEIRGAGNLLGPQQHGIMQAVGFDLYSRLLESTVRELRGEVTVPEVPAQVAMGVEAFLPDAWAPDARIKLEVYKRLAGAESERELEAAAALLRDRLGPPPPEAALLTELARVRILASGAGVRSVKRVADQVHLTFRGRNELEGASSRAGGGVRRTGDRAAALRVRGAPAEMVTAACDWLRKAAGGRAGG